MTHKLIIILGSISGAIAVILGAFGAHALKDNLSAAGRLETYETAVKYQMYHSLALILLGILMLHFQHRLLSYASYSFLLGTIIFSGSLFALCATGISKLGAITPIGGVFLIAGWVLLAIGIYKTA
ncbi:DUF423 domain-containing protein [Marivirga harenae]|mgnify:CR=1 FL=1|uniref:DUF423 domain-containing protein n=1 Tax=Marivirga harenae TaxID=2010992 RepID=UPI0026E1103B|nr:DUF423 domain-containing protein [Marivirga harenae]WKV12383.1 DUF423 domain-containing protein [Marivirga harenae]|tara:strand:- start:15764 stop:16141 length:378 start_codon:yes stop_codon:yes gene_type:complete